MRVALQGEQRIRFEMAGEGFEITSEGVAISPYHLLGASLASCTAQTVASWAEAAAVVVADLMIDVAWEMAAEPPKRVTRFTEVLHWPSLPENRARAAERAAGLCPIHRTLLAGAEVVSRLERA